MYLISLIFGVTKETLMHTGYIDIMIIKIFTVTKIIISNNDAFLFKTFQRIEYIKIAYTKPL